MGCGRTERLGKSEPGPDDWNPGQALTLGEPGGPCRELKRYYHLWDRRSPL